MPITCGSVGDIISISLLINDLVKCIDNNRGSSAEYQAVIRELCSLNHALLEVEVLLRSCEQTIQLNALSATANECADQCRKCITSFQGQMDKFSKSLQNGGSGSKVRDVVFKVRWQVSERETVAKFRAEISAHCFSMNMLLATTGITLTKLNDENLQTYLQQAELVRATSSATQASNLADIKSLLEENNTLAKVAASETKILGSRFDFDYFKKLGTDMLSFMQKIWKINFLTYKAVISLQTSLPAQLERCWTQEPATLEDALGRVTPVHLEFLDTWEAFQAVLEVRFRQLPGHRKIKHKEYALRSNVMKRDLQNSDAFGRCFLPGQRIDMSMIFDGGPGGSSSCPGCKFVTKKTEGELDAQIQCPKCEMWYQRIIEEPPPEPQSVEVTKESASIPSTPQPLKRRRHRDDGDQDDPAQFRRVRLRCRGPNRNLDTTPAGGVSLTFLSDSSTLADRNSRIAVPDGYAKNVAAQKEMFERTVQAEKNAAETAWALGSQPDSEQPPGSHLHSGYKTSLIERKATRSHQPLPTHSSHSFPSRQDFCCIHYSGEQAFPQPYHPPLFDRSINNCPQPGFGVPTMQSIDVDPDLAAELLLAHGLSTRSRQYRSNNLFDDSSYCQFEDGDSMLWQPTKGESISGSDG